MTLNDLPMASARDPADEPAAFNALAEANGWFYRCDPGPVFSRPELQALTRLWHEKANARGSLPARGDFDMRSLKPFLRNISFLERSGPEDAPRFRFRLFGSALAELFGERTGQYLDEMTSPTLLRNWTAAYEMIIRFRRPVRIYNHKLSSVVNGELFGAPLAPDAEGNPMVMAAAYVALKEAMPSPP